MKRLRSAALTGLCLTGVLFPFVAAADIISDAAPPPNRVEHEPPHRDGYVWAPGHWEWSGGFFHWTSGTWIIEHRGRHWVADQWVPSGNQWRYVQGHWAQ